MSAKTPRDWEWWRRGDAEYEAAQQAIFAREELDANEKFQLQHDAAIRAFENNVLGPLVRVLFIATMVLGIILVIVRLLMTAQGVS